MLRQSGLAAKQLLFGSGLQQSSQNQSSKLLWNAMLFSSKAEGAAAQQVAASESVAQTVPQFSSEAAAALAAKRRGLIGSGIILKPSKPFSVRGLASASQPAAAAAATEAGAQPADKFAGLKKVLKAAAALAAALGLTATTAAADSPAPWQYGFQDTATSTAQAMIDLHHDIFFFVISIVVLVFYMMAQFVTKFHYARILKPEKLTHHTTLEVIWTIIPTFIVVLIAIPSLTLIYSLDQHTERPGLTVKIIGRQWYWSYEMHDHLQHKLLDPDRLVAVAEKALVK